MRIRPVVLMLAAALAPATLAAQQAQAPASCAQAIVAWRTEQITPARDAYMKATDSNRTALMQKYSAASTAASNGALKMATDCIAKFPLASVPPVQLMDMITLYGIARDTVGTRLATERLLAAKNLPPRAQAGAWTLAMQQELARQSSHFGIIDSAEKIVAKIDMLPDSVADMKLNAHHTMLGRYEYLDVAEGLRMHALAVIALARKLNRSSDIISANTYLARSYADRLQPDSALRILAAAEKEFGAPATEAYKDFRDRYALIGTPAAKITAKWWINADAPAVIAPAAGKVTLMEFTAHWCGPCKNSYPGLNTLAERFKGTDFTGVMVTQLYGYLGTQKNLTAEQEVAADREYFGTEHALKFPVAINDRSVPVPGQPFPRPQPDADYRVSGIPQIMLIDKRGIIRQIVTGWDQGNTERFSTYIRQLLNERVNTPNP